MKKLLFLALIAVNVVVAQQHEFKTILPVGFGYLRPNLAKATSYYQMKWPITFRWIFTCYETYWRDFDCTAFNVYYQVQIATDAAFNNIIYDDSLVADRFNTTFEMRVAHTCGRPAVDTMWYSPQESLKVWRLEPVVGWVIRNCDPWLVYDVSMWWRVNVRYAMYEMFREEDMYGRPPEYPPFRYLSGNKTVWGMGYEFRILPPDGTDPPEYLTKPVSPKTTIRLN